MAIVNDRTMQEDQERTLLLPRPPSVKSHQQTSPFDPSIFPLHLRSHLLQPLRTTHASIILVSCYLATGLLDSAATSTWGSFVSMQTGNTVYLATGLSNLIFPSSTSISSSTDGPRWIKSGVSLVAFCLGSYTFARFHRHATHRSPRTRWVLVSSFAIQSLLVVVAAVIVKMSSSNSPTGATIAAVNDTRWQTLVPLSLLAFQSAGQVVASRVLQQSSLTSVVLTSVYCDLFSDTHLFSLTVTSSANRQRNERVSAVVLLILGGIIGNLLVRYGGGSNDSTVTRTGGIVWVLAVIAIMKIGLTTSWLFWQGEDPEPDQQQVGSGDDER